MWPTYRLGFVVRHIWAFRQDARAHPVLPGKQRSKRNIALADQIGVEEQLAHLTAEQQPLLRAIALPGVPTTWACLTRVVSAHLQGFAAYQ